MSQPVDTLCSSIAVELKKIINDHNVPIDVIKDKTWNFIQSLKPISGKQPQGPPVKSGKDSTQAGSTQSPNKNDGVSDVKPAPSSQQNKNVMSKTYNVASSKSQSTPIPEMDKSLQQPRNKTFNGASSKSQLSPIHVSVESLQQSRNVTSMYVKSGDQNENKQSSIPEEDASNVETSNNEENQSDEVGQDIKGQSIDEQNQMMDKYKQENEDLRKDIQSLKTKNEDLKNRIEEKEQALKRKEEEIDTKYKKKLSSLENNYKQVIDEKEKNLKDKDNKNVDLTNDKKILKSKIKEFEHYLQEKDIVIADLTKERNEIQTRYSQVASEKLNQNNPDIVDLSDPNRAMKLGERYSDVYNEEWTDAYEALTGRLKMPEKECVRYLLDSLNTCLVVVMQITQEQFTGLQVLLSYPVQNSAYNVEQIRFKQPPKMAPDSIAKLKSLRRKEANSSIEIIKYAVLSTMFKKEKDGRVVEAAKGYIQKCAELCWLMALHDPPLTIKFDVKPGTKVDTNLYTTISKGQDIDYLVWPPLFNGENGGLLQKGVVEVVKVVTKKGKK